MFQIPTSNTQQIFITGVNRYDIDGKIHCSAHSLAQILDNGFGFSSAQYGITPEAIDQLRDVELPATVECQVQQTATKNRSGKSVGVSNIIGIKVPDTNKLDRPSKA